MKQRPLVVALGLLTISTLLIAEALGAAIEYVRTAELARRATAAAVAIADSTSDRADLPAGWRAVGTPGADGLPGTGDDGPPDPPAAGCRRQVIRAASHGSAWVWIESTCAPEGDGGAFESPGLVGGRLARSAVLVRVQ